MQTSKWPQLSRNHGFAKARFIILISAIILVLIAVFLGLNIRALVSIKPKPVLDVRGFITQPEHNFLSVQLYNPSFIPFSIQGYDFELKIEGEHLTHLKSSDTYKIKARASTKIPLGLNLSLIKNLSGALGKKIRITGKVKLKVCFFKHDYPLDFIYELPTLPKIHR